MRRPQIWEDLQTTEIPEARIDTNTTTVDSFLMRIHFLKCYLTETERAALLESASRQRGTGVGFTLPRFKRSKDKR
jgi:hypothetical protein